ncbi:hypothetical protein Tco_1479998 [Tanacetum coccineum]
MQNSVSLTPYVPPSKKDYEILFQPLFDEYFNPLPRAVSPVSVAVALKAVNPPVHLRQLPLIKMYHLLLLHQQIRKFNLKSFIKVLKNKFMDIKMHNFIMHPLPSKSSSSDPVLKNKFTRVISLNLHHLNQLFDTLTKLTKNHPLENVIDDPSRLVSTRSQLQEHVIWCYFDTNDNPIPFGGKWSG